MNDELIKVVNLNEQPWALLASDFPLSGVTLLCLGLFVLSCFLVRREKKKRESKMLTAHISFGPGDSDEVVMRLTLETGESVGVRIDRDVLSHSLRRLGYVENPSEADRLFHT